MSPKLSRAIQCALPSLKSCSLFLLFVVCCTCHCLSGRLFRWSFFSFINSFRNVSVGVRGDGLDKSGLYTVLVCLFIWAYGNFRKQILIFTNFLLKGIVRWDFSTHYSRRGRFREENAFYRIKNGHIFPEIWTEIRTQSRKRFVEISQLTEEAASLCLPPVTSGDRRHCEDESVECSVGCGAFMATTVLEMFSFLPSNHCGRWINRLLWCHWRMIPVLANWPSFDSPTVFFQTRQNAIIGCRYLGKYVSVFDAVKSIFFS